MTPRPRSQTAIEDLPEFDQQPSGVTAEQDVHEFIKGNLQDAIDELEQLEGAHDKLDWVPLPHQTPPKEDFDVWGMLGGRGAGKTEMGSRYVLDHLRKYKHKARVGIGAPTLTDVRTIMIEGPSGILAHALPGEIVDYNRTLLTLKHRSGGIIRGMGSEVPDRWRGHNWSLLWADELASWVEESWHMARFGLRLGTAQAIFTTTPKNRIFLRQLLEEDGTVMTHATTYDNPHLAARARKALEARYGGTSLGRQELLALLIDSAEGALWNRDLITHVESVNLRDVIKIVVGVDPKVSAEALQTETGVVVCGKTVRGRGVVLADLSTGGTPDQWGQAVITAYAGWRANLVVGEVNNGGDLVEKNLRSIMPHINYQKVTASRGKAKRAEPIVGLYERGLIDHVGQLEELENQMCLWEPQEPDMMPCDRLDALVWSLTELFVEELAPIITTVSQAGKRKSTWMIHR